MSIDWLFRAEQRCWGLPPPHPLVTWRLSSHRVFCSVDPEHVCLQALSCIHQGRRWWVGPAEAPRWHWAAVRKLEPADPTGSPGEGCSEVPARWPQLPTEVSTLTASEASRRHPARECRQGPPPAGLWPSASLSSKAPDTLHPLTCSPPSAILGSSQLETAACASARPPCCPRVWSSPTWSHSRSALSDPPSTQTPDLIRMLFLHSLHLSGSSPDGVRGDQTPNGRSSTFQQNCFLEGSSLRSLGHLFKPIIIYSGN